jgi:hypothetical protein
VNESNSDCIARVFPPTIEAAHNCRSHLESVHQVHITAVWPEAMHDDTVTKGFAHCHWGNRSPDLSLSGPTPLPLTGPRAPTHQARVCEKYWRSTFFAFFHPRLLRGVFEARWFVTLGESYIIMSPDCDSPQPVFPGKILCWETFWSSH